MQSFNSWTGTKPTTAQLPPLLSSARLGGVQPPNPNGLRELSDGAEWSGQWMDVMQNCFRPARLDNSIERTASGRFAAVFVNNVVGTPGDRRHMLPGFRICQIPTCVISLRAGGSLCCLTVVCEA